MSINKPIYILGPCAAESREQVLLTASQLKDACGEIPFIYRAGAWKPRTSPHTFQGVGEEGLVWLQEVKQRLGLPVATEVATPEHVTKALEAGMDYLWIGARSSANPLAVQAIADAIVDWELVNGNFKGILIKNPVNADAGLWIGNIERLEKTGVPVIAVHRGCNHQPCWAMAHQVRLARPDIPMLLDPSHMSGEAVKVPELMKKIEELGLDGAMVEVHCDPKSALSDNAQQLTPNQVGHTLNPILSRLCLVSLNSPSDGSEELNWLRAEIDELDERLWDTIAARMEVSERIGKWKKAHGVAPLQPERYQQIVEKLKIKNEEVKNKSLSTDFMLHIWELIHKESLRKQE
ncbi:MAG: bifunctional 3-deoxy-7-phosphoheptulonate synthase/chorismate mutase type II [Paludibacteraceae bacterium]|nr:bifunctional 3-deoxy-7-phosphoheptulonate synthase/chorismate mutase type II [Paludibacteraceae bacterium]